MSTSLITEARDALRLIGGDWPRHEKQPQYVERLARATTLTKSAVERILYGKRKRLYADEWLVLTKKAATLRAAQQEQEARNNEITGEIHARRALAVDQQREPGAIAGVRAQGAQGAGPRAAAAVPRPRE